MENIQDSEAYIIVGSIKNLDHADCGMQLHEFD